MSLCEWFLANENKTLPAKCLNFYTMQSRCQCTHLPRLQLEHSIVVVGAAVVFTDFYDCCICILINTVDALNPNVHTKLAHFSLLLLQRRSCNFFLTFIDVERIENDPFLYFSSPCEDLQIVWLAKSIMFLDYSKYMGIELMKTIIIQTVFMPKPQKLSFMHRGLRLRSFT